MKPSDEMRSAFPQPDERFRACIRRTLDDLRAEERTDRSMKNTKLRIGILIAALVLVLSTIVAGAAVIRYGTFDFLNRFSGKVLPEAGDLVQTDVPQTGGQTQGDVTFALREAVYDGRTANLIVTAIPASDDILLVGPDAMPEYPLSDLGLSGTGTIAEYAAASGKDTIYSISLHDPDGEYGMSSMDYMLESDGTLALILTCIRKSDADSLPVTLRCIAVPMNADGTRDGDRMLRTELSFELSNTVQSEQVLFEDPVVYENCGVTVQSLEVNSTPLGLYYTIVYRVTDQETFDALDGGLYFRFVDENGEEIPSSPVSGDSAFCIDEANGVYIWEGALTAHEALPDSMTLTAVNLRTDDRASLDTHTFTR